MKRMAFGRVVGRKNGEVEVRLSAKGEAGCRGCGMCLSSDKGASSCRVVHVTGGDALEEGAEVRVEITEPDPAVAALLVFGLPLGLAAAMAGLAALVLSIAGHPPHWAAGVGASAVGLFLGFLAARAVERHWRKAGAFQVRLLPQRGQVDS